MDKHLLIVWADLVKNWQRGLSTNFNFTYFFTKAYVRNIIQYTNIYKYVTPNFYGQLSTTILRILECSIQTHHVEILRRGKYFYF